MVTHGNETHHGKHFEMYRNIKSPCYVSTTNTTIEYDSKTDQGLKSTQYRGL